MRVRQTILFKKLTRWCPLACNGILCGVLAIFVWVTWPNVDGSASLITRGVSVGNKMSYLNEGNEICRVAKEEALRIEVEAVIQSVNGFPNIFQTDDVNMGVRLEAGIGQSPQEAALAYVFTRSDGEMFGVAIGKVSIKEKFSTVLTIYKGKTLVASLDGVQVPPVLTDLSLSCDAVKVGGGFSTDRNLDGDASVNFIRIFGINQPAPKLTRLTRVAFIMSLMMLPFITRRILLTKNKNLEFKNTQKF